MYNAPAPLTALLVHGVHRWATCWFIERTDAVTYGFTNHDRPLVVDGYTYTPFASPEASAVQKTEGLGRVQDTEIRGFIDSNFITEDDLRTGKYRGAKVIEFVVDWRFPWAGKFQTLVYWIRETTFDNESWTAQCEGLLGRMRGKVGQVLNRTCGHTLGDSKCQVAVISLATTGNVDSIVESRVGFTATLGVPQPDGYFDAGVITWTSGANSGIDCEVKSYKLANGTFALQLKTPYAIVVGDDFNIIPGCDKNLSTCREKYSNVVNFGGFPTLVGVDKQFATTGAPV
jgi:uncharacterized phage protein (TIGR02218 family)